MITRRKLFLSLAYTGATAGLLTIPGFSGQSGISGLGGGPAYAQASEEAMMTAGPLGEKSLGDPDAKIKVIEYASMTCIHCANFHNNVFPAFKEKYIDTGKVQFLFREYPLDPLAAGAFMLARCAGEERFFPFVDILFKNHATWTRTNDPVTALFNISRQAGFTQETFDTCLSNQRLLDGVNWVKDRGTTLFNVESTPTFFINGVQLRDRPSLENLDAAIAEHM